MKHRLVIATKNPHKVLEMTEIIGRLMPGFDVVTGLEWPDVEETGDSLVENALLKADAVMRATGLPALADDTGLEVGALDGEPGVRSARFAGPQASYADNRAELLRRLDGVTDRHARFRTVMVLSDPEGLVTVVEGTLDGDITTAERGDHGFGYDPIFEVEGRTLAEYDEAEKNGLSHRAAALKAMAQVLSERQGS